MISKGLCCAGEIVIRAMVMGICLLGGPAGKCCSQAYPISACGACRHLVRGLTEGQVAFPCILGMLHVLLFR